MFGVGSHISHGRPATTAELILALGLDPRSSRDALASELVALKDRARARLDFAPSAYLPPAQKPFEKVWHDIRGNFLVPTTASLFGPSFEVRRPTDLSAVKELHQFLAPLTEVSRERAQQILNLDLAIQQERLTSPPQKRQILWSSCVYQAKRVQEGSCGFLSPEESAVLTLLQCRPIAEHIQVGARLGRTNLAWIKLEGKWQPCFENSRYKSLRSILDLPPKRLRACMSADHLPTDPKAAAQQRAILARALRVQTNSFGDESRRRMNRAELRSALLREFPPEG